MKSLLLSRIRHIVEVNALRGTLIALVIVVMSTAACVASVSPWGVTTRLTSTTNPGWMDLTPYCEYDTPSGLFRYTYRLTNCTTSENIESFALTFSQPMQDQLSDFITPEGWELDRKLIEGYKLVWGLGLNEVYALKPGDTKIFGFSSMLQPSNDLVVPASAKNGAGFGGVGEETCGPMQPQVSMPPSVPEASTLVLACSGMACVGFIRPRLRRR